VTGGGPAVDWTIPPVFAVVFLATLIRSAFRFGEALVAVPLAVLLYAHVGLIVISTTR
jgi:hypothetical protein